MEAFYDTPPFPRPALAFLAAYLRRAEVEVAVLDCKYSRLGYDKALDRIKDFNPDIVAVTAMTNEILQASQIAQLVKMSWPEIVVVIGGVHVTALPERTLREFPEFNYAVIGEGEIPLLKLVKAIDGGVPGHEPIPGIAGIDSDGNFWFDGTSQLISEMDTLPVPAWDLFAPAQEYMLTPSGAARSTALSA